MTQRFVKSAVIGHPIAHSKSPLIHNYWIAQYGLSGSYEAIDIVPDDLKVSVDDLIAQGFVGFNVTIPHKEAIMDLCGQIDETARKIGAVNTVCINEDGALYGSNTDAYGFIENIKASAPDFDFAGGMAVVLGAGGAARAVIYGLLDSGCPHVVLINRTLERAQELAEFMNVGDKISVVDWGERSNALNGASLLVNTTSLGMEGKPVLELDLSALPVSALVSDIVYAPLETELLKSAKARGNRAISGIGMLLHQACPGFKAWQGVSPEVTQDLQDLVLK